MTTFSNKQVYPIKAALGEQLTAKHFSTRTESILAPELKPNELFVRNLYIALDPYTRYALNTTDPSTVIGKPLSSYGLAQVVQSTHPTFPIGSIISGFIQWEQYSHITNLIELRLVDHKSFPSIPLQTHITTLGMPGATVYKSLERITTTPGESIFISSAAGTVGLLASQIAKSKGLKVFGSCGSDSKVEYLKNEIGLDGVFNYKTEDTKSALKRLVPQGVDIFFDNVGGQTLTDLLDIMNPFGRILIVGQISQVDGQQEQHGIKNLNLLLFKSISMIGFNYMRSNISYPDLIQEWAPLILENKLKNPETLVDGLENGPQGLVDVFEGKYSGKVLIKVADL